MDDTAQSRVSDAASTRKRRSSILKSQRPARTPFSELEFNVATPTDTAKSRRVSFSRRTGVAEFITNEATTTWKNFYEEHNKSLESSGNDSDAHASRQPVEHLGKRIFDQQFEEVEAFDFGGSLNPVNNNGSLNNVNFAEQLASLDRTSDGKLTAPQNNFELSALTDQQSKIFGNDFTVHCTGEASGRIDINFSDIQQIGAEKDDLDEIQKDIARVSNMVCHGPFGNRPDMSEYIEVDLNMTHVAVRNEEDMSITDTVHSPKVQDVSKSCSIDKKINLSKDWVTDKENIAINPYAAPRESANFAINDEPDQVLVFDGKRLTIQTEKVENDRNKDYRKTLLPNLSAETPQRKTIVLNMNDDLPNFADDMLNSKGEISGYSSAQELKSNTIYKEDISMTLTVNKVESVPKRKTLHDVTGNISMTQALPTNIIIETEIEREKSDMLKTVVYEEETGNISVTQALPAKIITSNAKIHERRRTVLFEKDTGNISITQAIPSNIILNEDMITDNDEKTKIFIDNDDPNMSVTQGISSNIILAQKCTDKRKTIVFGDDSGNISITRAIPTNIVLTDKQVIEKRRTIIYEDETGDISVTQALPNVILAQQLEERRRTVVYDNDTGNISVTQAMPSNIIQECVKLNETNKIGDNKIPVSQSLPMNDVNKRSTIVYEDDTGNISITQALPAKVFSAFSEDNILVIPSNAEEPEELDTSTTKKAIGKKQVTIVYDNDEDISMTEAIPDNVIVCDIEEPNKKTIVFDNEEADISMTQAIPANVMLLEHLTSDDNIDKENIENKIIDETEDMSEEVNEEVIKEKVVDYDMYEQDAIMTESPIIEPVQEHRKSVLLREEECADMSITEAIATVHNAVQEAEKRKTVIFDNDNGNVSMTKPIPAELMAFQNEILNKSKNKELDVIEQEVINPGQTNGPDVIVYQATTDSGLPTLTDRTEQGDLKSERQINSNNNSDVKVISSSRVTEEVLMPGNIYKDSVDDASLKEGHIKESNFKEDSIKTDSIKEDSVKENSSMQEDANSEDQSLRKHPPVEEKVEVLNMKVSNLTMDVDIPGTDNILREMSEPNYYSQAVEAPKAASIRKLLNVSHVSSESCTDEKNVMAQLESHSSMNAHKRGTETNSSESMFYIIKDSDDDAPTDSEGNTNQKNTKKVTLVENKTPSLEYRDEEEDLEIVDDLKKKLAELKTVTSEKNESLSRLYDKIANAELEEISERDENEALREQSSMFKKANDTKELLDMISDFTGKNDEEEEDVEKLNLIKAKGLAALDNKVEVINQPKRLSFAPTRQSIILSREDLLNNISMAQAVLQKSRIELDETDSIDDDSRNTTLDHSFNRKSERTSDVVKTLNFDDESSSENSFRAESKATPLKKTAFGETSYMTESKAKVIPTYLKDVSDGIKELMMDLVKPMADTLPFEAAGVDKNMRRVPSTQSTHVQANLITSSQTDIDPDLCLPDSLCDMDKLSTFGGPILKTHSQNIRSPLKYSTNSSEMSSEFEMYNSRQKCLNSRSPQQSSPKVLVFDHLNPLNNILLGPMDYSDSHRYNPGKSNETICVTEPNRAQIHFKEDDYDADHVSTQYRIEARNPHYGDAYSKQDDEQSVISTLSRPMSLDQSIDVRIMELKDTEVNTVIAMKGNKELLEASSSLTLVDDTASKTSTGLKSTDTDGCTTPSKKIPLDIDSSGHRKVKISRSPVEVIYKIEEQESVVEKAEKVASEITTDEESDKTYTKPKKRIYSPTKTKSTKHPVDITPKPTTKMQKISNSPKIYKESTKLAAEKDVSDTTPKSGSTNSRVKSPRKSKSSKQGLDLTVQQLITEYNIEATLDQTMDKKILEALNTKSVASTAPVSRTELECNSLDVISSFTSSKNAMKEVSGTTLSSSTSASQPSQLSTVQSQQSRMVDWHPELMTSVSSKNLSDPDSGMNVVAKIDMLPFMGSHECEWETSSGDTWTFRLLHGRLRLTARLAHRHENSARTRVRGDTPVLDVNVETVQLEKKNPVATLCVRFACETMRYMVGRVCRSNCYASDIPPLLRRCAAVARVALRWGRAMHDAKLHLAYTLDNDGYLTLKVANIPLRSVWEVRMHVELVVEDAREAPWPRASNVRVVRVVSDVSVPEHDVRRALDNTPRDWGHAPRTIWRIFRYLKNKTRDDDLLLA